jgi:putative intracellular protease/amidase
MSSDITLPVASSNAWVRQDPRIVPWIWEGVVAEGAVTLLSAPEKIGKTSLLSLLLDRRRAGGALLGRGVFPGNTILASEERDRLWSLRQPPLDFGDRLTYLRPDSPTRRGWRRYIDKVCEHLSCDEPLSLVVIDTATRLMPLGLRNARAQRGVLDELSVIAQDTGVLILNQSRNVHRPLAAFADIVIEMAIPSARTLFSAAGRGADGQRTRRRTFTGVGRYPDTLECVTAELNADGTDYVLTDGSIALPGALLATLQSLLSVSLEPLTQRDLLTRWPGDPPRADSLWRALARGLESGLFTATGAGKKNDPYRFAIAKKPAAG